MNTPCEDGARDQMMHLQAKECQESRIAGNYQKLGKKYGTNSFSGFQNLQKEPILPTLGFQNPSPQNCERIHFWVLSPQCMIICYTALGN